MLDAEKQGGVGLGGACPPLPACPAPRPLRGCAGLLPPSPRGVALLGGGRRRRSELGAGGDGRGGLEQGVSQGLGKTSPLADVHLRPSSPSSERSPTNSLPCGCGGEMEAL